MNKHKQEPKTHNSCNVVIFDLFGVLFNFGLTKPSLAKKGLLTIYIKAGGSTNVFSPIDRGMRLFEQCAAKKTVEGTRQNKLFVLSNIHIKPYAMLSDHFSHVLSRFDGIVTSGVTGFRKPDERIYQHLLETHKIDPSRAVFIDDKASNVRAAETCGLHGIVCDDYDRVEQELKKMGAL